MNAVMERKAEENIEARQNSYTLLSENSFFEGVYRRYHLESVGKANQNNDENSVFTGKNGGMDGVLNSKNLALYSYAHQNPLIYIDPDGNKVFIYTVLIPETANKGAHSWVVVVNKDGKVTFSGTNEPGLKLGVIKNRESDYNRINGVTPVEIAAPKGMTEEQWDDAVIKSGDWQTQKSLKRNYDLLGGDRGYTSGNCHVVTTQIIEGAGGEIPADIEKRVPGLIPGMNDPKTPISKPPSEQQPQRQEER